MTDIDRRTVAKAAAWSIPIVALAVGAPAQAASLPVCKKETYVFDKLTQNDVASILIVTGQLLTVTYVKAYRNQTSINLNHNIVWRSPDNGVAAGLVKTFDLSVLGICDPTFIQVDGNNTHYLGGGVFQ